MAAWVLARPLEFAGGATRWGGWDLDADHHDVNPRLSITPFSELVVALWRLWRPAGGMGAGHLPAPGGAMDQPVLLMAGIEWFNREFERVRPQDQR